MGTFTFSSFAITLWQFANIFSPILLYCMASACYAYWKKIDVVDKVLSDLGSWPIVLLAWTYNLLSAVELWEKLAEYGQDADSRIYLLKGLFSIVYLFFASTYFMKLMVQEESDLKPSTNFYCFTAACMIICIVASAAVFNRLHYWGI